MPQGKISCIVLAAGKGARMKSDLPKPLHPVGGAPMLRHVLTAAEALAPEKIVVVTGPGMEGMEKAAYPHVTSIQRVPNGTGGAALAAREHFKGYDGDILVIFGDMPLITTATLQRMVEARRQLPAVGLAFSAMRPADPASYGRMVLDEDGTLKKIVEFKDATPAEKSIALCNGGVVCADGAKLFEWLAQIGNDNAQGEYYLTDLPQIARRDNRLGVVVEVAADEMAGANTRVELAQLERLMQARLREKHMLSGVTLVDPASVFFCHDTVVGRDVTIEPDVFFGPDVVIGDNVTIHAFSHISGATVENGAEIGPFARLRPGARIGAEAKVGNFVEVKNAALGKGAKANHLSYLGDASIGDKANIGAGTITCNYDGYMKYRTTVGAGAFIGSNTALVAPVTVGDGAIVGAGSTISKDVPANALAVTRAAQTTRDGWAETFRQKKSKEKTAAREKK